MDGEEAEKWKEGETVKREKKREGMEEREKEAGVWEPGWGRGGRREMGT